MTRLYFKSGRPRPVGLTVTILVFTGLLWCLAYAQEQPQATPAGEPGEKIHIQADRLISDSQGHFAEFSGNVSARQGNVLITADRLKIHYDSQQRPSASAAGDAAAITKLIAQGHVKIILDDRVAVTDRAEYSIDQRVLVLSGPDSKITAGKDSIAGARIVFYRNEGRIQVEGQADQRVEAIIYSGQGGIQ